MKFSSSRIFPGQCQAASFLAGVAVAQRVVTESGAISGVSESGLSIYKGVPFRCPRLGDLRCRPPGRCFPGLTSARPTRLRRHACKTAYPCRARRRRRRVRVVSTSTSGHRQKRAALESRRILDAVRFNFHIRRDAVFNQRNPIVLDHQPSF